MLDRLLSNDIGPRVSEAWVEHCLVQVDWCWQYAAQARGWIQLDPGKCYELCKSKTNREVQQNCFHRLCKWTWAYRIRSKGDLNQKPRTWIDKLKHIEHPSKLLLANWGCLCDTLIFDQQRAATSSKHHRASASQNSNGLFHLGRLLGNTQQH